MVQPEYKLNPDMNLDWILPVKYLRRLKLLAMRRGVSIQILIEDAIDDMWEKRKEER